MTTLYQHSIYCITEGARVTAWTESKDPLTTCPTDTAHEINPDSEYIVKVQAPNTVVVNKQPNGGVGNDLRTDSVSIAVPANGTNVGSISWGYNIAVYGVGAAVSPSAVGCTLTMDTGTTPLGFPTADVPAGATEVSVPAAVASNLRPGINLTLTGPGGADDLGAITNVDPSGVVTVTRATTAAFPAATTTVSNSSAMRCRLAPAWCWSPRATTPPTGSRR